MKKRIAICTAFILVLLTSRVNAQAVLSVAQISYPDTTSFYSIDNYFLRLVNTGSQNFSGTVLIHAVVDTTNTGALNQNNTVAVAPDSFTIAANSSDTFTIQIPIQPNYFKQGINTVIIWPVNDPQSTNLFIVQDTLELQVNVIGSIGVNEIEGYDKKNTLFFPNPFQDYMYIRNQDPKFVIERVRVWDMYGQLVKDLPFNGTLNMSGLAQGTYVIEFLNHSNQLRRYKAIKE